MNRIEVAQELTLVMFGVSLAWTIYTSMEHYPRIHRFGHIWERWRDLAVILISWPALALVIGLSLYSIFFSFAQLQADYSNAEAQRDPWLIPALGVIAFYYVYVPYLANRLILGAVLMIVPEDFKENLSDPEARRHYILPRISKTTIRIWEAYPRRAGGVIFCNSLILIALLLLVTPNVTVTQVEGAACLFLATTLVGAIALVAHFPYGRILAPPRLVTTRWP